MFHKNLEKVVLATNLGALLRGVERDAIERGQVLAVPGTVTPHTKLKPKPIFLQKMKADVGTPFFSGYRPQFYFRTTDVTGKMDLPEGIEMIMPGDNAQITVELSKPIAMEEQLRFAIR